MTRDLARRVPMWLLAAAASVVVALSLIRVPFFWSSHAYLDTVAGVWTAAAVDLAGGVLYRPLVGPDGFGGTRYFPLHPTLHAMVIALTGDPVRSGQIVAAFSVSLLVLGVYLVVRALGGARLLAASTAAGILASQTTQHALLSIRGDALPAALNMLGIAYCVSGMPGVWHAVFAACLFVLAFAAKPTALWGVLAAAAWLTCQRRPRSAALVVCASALGFVVVLAVMQLASHGRAFDALRAGGSVGFSMADALRAPAKFAQIARQVPETLVLIQLGFAAVLTGCFQTRSVCGFPTLLFAAVLVVTVPIFAFAGTDSNHLVDTNAAAFVVLASLIVSLKDQRADFVVATLAVAMLAASLSLGTGLINRRAEQRHGTLEQTLALIHDRQRPILAENPLVPITAGQRPYLLDSYMFRILRASDPSFDEPLRLALERQAFSAVVLERDPHDARGREWYKSAFFGGNFIETMEESYQETGRVGARVIYTPARR